MICFRQITGGSVCGNTSSDELTARVTMDNDLKKKVRLKFKNAKLHPNPQPSDLDETLNSDYAGDRKAGSTNGGREDDYDGGDGADDDYDSNDVGGGVIMGGSTAGRARTNGQYNDEEDDDDDGDEDEDEGAGGGGADGDDDEEDIEQEDLHVPEDMEVDPERAHLCAVCAEPAHTALEVCPVRRPVAVILDAISLDQWLDRSTNVTNQLDKPIKKEDDESALAAALGGQEVAGGGGGGATIGGVGGSGIGGPDGGGGVADAADSAGSEENYFNAYVAKLKRAENCYAIKSMPEQFVQREGKVWTVQPVQRYTRLGPLVGSAVQAVDVPEDSGMRQLIELWDGAASAFVATDNRNTTNWLGLVRPAASAEECNVQLVADAGRMFYVTTRALEVGEELVYWSDAVNSAWGRKKVEKMSK